MISWEAISALAALISAVVVVATVVVGTRQVRVAAQQVEHLRRATQLEGTMNVFDELSTTEYRSAIHFVLNDLAGRMRNDAAFRDGVTEVGLADARTHPELTVLRTYEKVGVYVKHGLLEGEVLVDFFGPLVIATWECLRDSGVVAVHRAARGKLLWENYEVLYGIARAYIGRRDPESLAAIQGSRQVAHERGREAAEATATSVPS